MEFAQYGSLRSFMHKSRAQMASSSESKSKGIVSIHVMVLTLPGDLDQGLMAEYQVTRKDILSFAWQVARGMEYLSKKKVRCIKKLKEERCG